METVKGAGSQGANFTAGGAERSERTQGSRRLDLVKIEVGRARTLRRAANHLRQIKKRPRIQCAAALFNPFPNSASRRNQKYYKFVMFVKLAVPGRCRSFAPGLSTRSATPEVVGEDNEQLHHRRLVIHPEQRRNIESHVVARPPGDRRSYDKTVVRRAPALFVA